MKTIAMPVKNNNLSLISFLLEKVSWVTIILFLVFLPFQKIICHSLKLSSKFSWVDEFFISIILIFFFLFLFYLGKTKVSAVKILFWLLFLAIIGIISGLSNANSFVVTTNGIFDYIKCFLVIPVFCFFSIREEKIKNLYKILHHLALFLCLVAIIQEIAFFIGVPLQKVGIFFIDIRFNIMRASSLMGHPNIFGLYTLLFFILNFSVYRRICWQNLLFITGIFLSVSRMVWVAFFLALFVLLVQRKGKKIKRLFFLVMPIIIIVALAIPSFFLYTAKELGSEKFFRGYALIKSIEIWKDHPFFGVGPGMFGGVVSFVFKSPVFQQYNFSPYWFKFMSNFRSLDQFWPQILAEMGIVGVFCFSFLLFTLWKVAKKASLTTKNFFQKKMLLGLSVIPLVLFVYLFGSGLNLTPFLLTYSVLLGMVLGMKHENTFN